MGTQMHIYMCSYCHFLLYLNQHWHYFTIFSGNTEHTLKNGTVSEVSKKCISHLPRAQHKLSDVSKEVGLEINVEKTKYILLSRHKNVSQNRDIKTANRPFENVSQFKYLGTTVINQNLIQGDIKSRLNSVMLATTQSRTFCLLVSCWKT
jgi:hypothetical protein